ncbi:DUF802 domain-containing protein [Luteimonas terricola]|uniref:DUF802 domain-containing protein n=1 Tax=Luteimonas terricola TaxID=645597 RepID=A0ABQ2EKG1_9GAMM|nr:DUF802 domain-containing protein [Luteimonas terricola]GGK14393.1 hypothetical protein GCM10011394_24540 [Luteimonas terricola]
MNKTFLNGFVFAAGLLAVCWIGAGYVGTHAPALAVTALIGVLYLVGGLELYRYRQASATLVAALAAPPEPPDPLATWLDRLDASLRTAVRMRIEGGQAPLPAPALTPYLVGMLVLLGMLGTLLGMLLTLRGTGMALQSASDLQAVRDSLAAPVEGLGVAFGTSIAGVATSAMLGLLSALCRRERAAAVRGLDAAVATSLRVHSRAHQRDEALRLMQLQAGAMPALVDRLQMMTDALEQQAQAAHARQAGQQEAFHAGTAAAYQRLADTMAQSLERSAADSARAAAGAVQPAVAAAMETLTREAAQLHTTVAGAVDRQLAALGAGFDANASAAIALWQQALDEQAASKQALAQALRESLDVAGERFVQRSGALLDDVSSRLDATALQVGAAWDEALARQQAQHAGLAEQHRQALDAATAGFAAQATTLLHEVEGSHARLQATLAEADGQRLEAWRGQVADIGAQSQAQAAAIIAEISTLVEAASEAPRAAAEVVAELRQKLSDSMVRDTAMLAERTQLMETLDTLLGAVNHASTEQRGAIDALVSTASSLLEQAGARFSDQADAGAGAIDAAAARLDAGAIGVAGLGESLAGAVQQFGESHARLTERLEGIAAALEASGTRSDEQLAYYVAQAREVVDLSVLAQKQIIGELRQLPGARAGADAA